MTVTQVHVCEYTYLLWRRNKVTAYLEGQFLLKYFCYNSIIQNYQKIAYNKKPLKIIKGALAIINENDV